MCRKELDRKTKKKKTVESLIYTRLLFTRHQKTIICSQQFRKTFAAKPVQSCSYLSLTLSHTHTHKISLSHTNIHTRSLSLNTFIHPQNPSLTILLSLTDKLAFGLTCNSSKERICKWYLKEGRRITLGKCRRVVCSNKNGGKGLILYICNNQFAK